MAPSRMQDWGWLAERLQKGDDCEAKVQEFLSAGGSPDQLILETIGNRDAKAAACPKSLTTLLEARGNPSLVAPQLGSPIIHLAAWHSTPEVVALLLKHRADIEANDGGEPTPPLNTALAAGNAKVALMLLERRANVQWKHKDGATALHVAVSWIGEDTSKRRLAPRGDEPCEVVLGLLHNGVDPMQREGMTGLTPLDVFRQIMGSSPWLADEENAPKIRAAFERTHALLGAASEAMTLKAKGNKAFGDSRHREALEAWVSARKRLEKESISGHHVAVMWSNEALCRRKKGDREGCQKACQAGLKHFCTQAVKKKLETNLAEVTADLLENPEGKPKAKAEPAAAKAAPAAAPAAAAEAPGATAAAADSTSSTPTSRGYPTATKTKTTLERGFFKDTMKPMYGPEGSVQGKNFSDLVDAPCMGTTVKVPYGKVLPVTVPNPKLEANSDSE